MYSCVPVSMFFVVTMIGTFCPCLQTYVSIPCSQVALQMSQLYILSCLISPEGMLSIVQIKEKIHI